jgi:RNA polymerase sigma-70 factor (ECF subfamily)
MRHAHWKDVSFDALTSDAESGVQFEAANDGSVERRLTRERVIAVLHEVINTQLTERQRRVIVAELQGMPQMEIAEQLQMNRNALYKLSHDARRKLKAQLELAGMVAADVLWAFT